MYLQFYAQNFVYLTSEATSTYSYRLRVYILNGILKGRAHMIILIGATIYKTCLFAYINTRCNSVYLFKN